MIKPELDQPSLENLIEKGDWGVEVFHPGGLDITRELAELCHVGRDVRVLDVASGTGEAACFLAETFHCRVIGLDASETMVKRSQEKATRKHVSAEFERGNALRLPFDSDSFDVVISECAVCHLDKETMIREMVRVARSGGYVGIHDLCWKDAAPEDLKRRLCEIEDERPETLAGWQVLLERAGLLDVRAWISRT